jgi:putative ABC transport system permease protein
MITILKTALSFLVAHRRKTWAIVASVALGVTALFLVGGYYEYNYWGLKQSLIRSQYGHLQLYPEGYRATRDADPFARSFERPDELVELLRADPEVRTVVRRSRAMGVIDGVPAEIWGVEPESEDELFSFTAKKEGNSLTSDDVLSCQMSHAFAEKIGVGLGDTVSVSGVRADLQVNRLDLTVQSLASGYAEEFNLMVVTMPERAFRDLFGTDATNEIAVLYRDDERLEKTRDELAARLSDAGWKADIAVWYEQAAYFRQVVAYYQGFYRVVLAIVAVIVFFATGTTMALSLLERTREFGTLMSMGARRRSLVAEILCEALIAGVIGLGLGIALSAALASAINAAGGITMPAAPGMETGIQANIIYSPQAAALSLVTALLVPVVAVILPARRIVAQSVVRLLDKGEK